MPYRPENELKRPDLKGEFLCGHCGKTFCHAASLNRHRLNFHGDDQQCMICMQQIPQNDTVRRHMQVHHGISRVFTCGCCNWTFPDKKELHSHNNNMLKTGGPGDAKAIAISSRAPGSLSQHELRGEERTPGARSRKKAKSATPKTPKTPSLNAEMNTTDMLSLLTSLAAGASTSTQTTPVGNTQIPTNWLSALLLNNPTLFNFFQQQQKEQSGTDDENQMSINVPSTSNNNENDADDVIKTENEEYSQLFSNPYAREMLLVKTEPSDVSTSSGPESGIGSGGDDICTPSPTSLAGSRTPESGAEVERPSPPSSSSPLDVVNLLASPGNRKRKSVDAIASLLFKKKCLME